MSLEKLIESHYAPKKGNELLVKLIEGKLNEQITGIEVDETSIDPKDKMFYGDERTLKLPIIRFTKSIGRKDNYERSFLDLVFSNIGKIAGRSDERISQRIQSIQNFLTPGNVNPNIKISEIMSYCIIVETFYHLVNDYDATVSGDLFEPLFAAMFDGVIVEAGDSKKKIKRNIKAEDVIIPIGGGLGNLPPAEELVSLKLLSSGGSVTQSFKNVLITLSKYGNLVYVVGYKDKKGEITFYGVDLTEDNIFEAVSNINEIFDPAQVNVFKKEFRNPPNEKYSLAGHMLSKIERNIEDINKIKDDIKSIEELVKKKEELITQEYSKGRTKMNMDYIKKLKLENSNYRKQIAQLAGQLKLTEHETSMKISADYFKTTGVNFGTITYTKDNLQNVLSSYTNVINDKVTNIYDNLSLLSNSINDFFLRGQGKDVKLAQYSVDRARKVESSITTYLPAAQKL